MVAPDNRAARKSSTRHGSKTATVAASPGQKRLQPDDALITPPPYGHSHNPKTHLFNDPAPIYKPMLTPGHHGKSGVTAHVGKMYPDRSFSGGNSPYGFRFHYNPASIHVSSQSDYSAMNTPQEGDGNNYFYNYGAMDFTILLNRQDEVLARTKTAHSVMGTREFAHLGTMYDLEWIYKTFNSSPDVSGTLKDLSKAGLYETSISYILKPTAMHVRFNKHLTYYGWPTSLDIQHQMFTANMIPVITMVQITIAGLAPQPSVSSPSKTVKSGNGVKVRVSKTQNGHTTSPGI